MIKNQKGFVCEWASKGMNIFHLYHQRKTFEMVHESNNCLTYPFLIAHVLHQYDPKFRQLTFCVLDIFPLDT